MADDEWRFSIDEVGPDGPDEDEDENENEGEDLGGSDRDESVDGEGVTIVGEDDDGPAVGIATGDPGSDEEGEGNVAGALAPAETVEPGTPDLENVVFTTAGAVVTVLVFAAVLVPLDSVTIGALAGAVVAGAALLYVFFRRI